MAQNFTSEITSACGTRSLVNLFLRFYSVGGKPSFFRAVFSSLDTIFQSLVLHSNCQTESQEHKHQQDNSYPDPAAETRVSGTQNNHNTRTQSTTDEDTPPKTQNQHTGNNHNTRENTTPRTRERHAIHIQI